MAGRVDEARVTLRRAADEANRVGHAIAEMYIWHNLGWFELGEREFEAARAALGHAMDLNRRIVDHNIATSGLLGLGYAELGLGHPAMPARTLRRCSTWCWRPRTPFPPDLANAAYGIALAADPARGRESGQLRRGVTALREAEGLGSDAELERIEIAFTERLDAAASRRWVEQADTVMSVEEVVRLARSLAERG